MKKRSIVAAAGLAAATVIGAIAPGGPASAGVPQVYVEVNVLAPGAGAALSALTVEVWDISGTPTEVGSCSPTSPITTGDDLGAVSYISCNLPGNGSYAIGVDGTPAGATATAECYTDVLEERIPGTGAEFVIDGPGEYGDCAIYVVVPTIFVDKVVDDGPSSDTPGDFALEVYSGGAMVASGTDTVADVCAGPLDSGNCAAITVPAGDLQLGETGPEGYVPSNVWCNTFRPNLPRPGEAFPVGVGELSLSDQAQGDTMAYCEITNQYYEGDLVVTKSVTNDDGGLLGPDDFTAEVWSVTNSTIVASGDCDASGDCIAVTLPIGDYQIGEADPQGYTPTVSCSVTREPDGPGPITSNPPTTVIQPAEAIPGDDAMVTVEPFGEVTCEIVNDDPTTTTTTTTMAPTTTDQGGGAGVPTTVAPVLPPTGDDNGTMAIIATLLIAVGGALLVARRRIA